MFMLIGNNFNKRCEEILLLAGKLCNYAAGEKVSVVSISEQLELDRTEIRLLFEYLIDLDFIKIESLGGPTLYGHISLTKKGLLKLKSLIKE